MTAEAIIALALALKASPVEARLIEAVAMQESSRRPDVKGDNGEAWGLFQFHRARWGEHSVAKWGKATRTQQVQAMLSEIQHCMKLIKKRGLELDSEHWVIYVGRHHNIGNCRGSVRHNNYTRSLWKHYKANKATADRVLEEHPPPVETSQPARPASVDRAYKERLRYVIDVIGQLMDGGDKGKEMLVGIGRKLGNNELPPDNLSGETLRRLISSLAYVALMDILDRMDKEDGYVA